MSKFELSLNNLADFNWRINNLYHIVDDSGTDIPFKLRPVQQQILDTMWFRNVIPKSRKHGVTTLIDLMALDRALFSPNQDCQIVSDTMTGAKRILRNIIKHAYSHLPQAVKDFIPIEGDSATDIRFANKSVLSVGTTSRSSTPVFLHVSEFGRIAAKFPDKAREIQTGSIQSVASDGNQMVFIESTAMGDNDFKKMVDRATRLKLAGSKLTKLDMKLIFLPWYDNPMNQLKEGDFTLTDYLKDYFAKLKLKLTPEQIRWYCTQYEILGPDIFSEHPSTAEEPFLVSLEGAYFAVAFRKIYQERRVCAVPYDENLPVDTWWDLGMDDVTAIWFTQSVPRGLNVIDYYENNGQGLEHYRDILHQRGYRYGVHGAPHDIKVREIGAGKTRLETAADLGIRFKVIPRVQDKSDAISAARNLLPCCWFDESKCETGIAHLEAYRKKWNTVTGSWDTKPLHDAHSNGADAYQTLAMGIGPVAGKTISTSALPTVESPWTSKKW